VVIDYNAEGLTEQLKDAPVDLIFDCVGGETVVEALGATKAGGKVVSVANFSIGEKTTAAKCTGNAFMVQPSAEQLTILAKLIDDPSSSRMCQFLHSPMLPRHTT
jgi:NADPH:quinone reductase-like Zn-dependent oxidoreductase